MNETSRGAMYGAWIGAAGLALLLLAFPAGQLLSDIALHRTIQSAADQCSGKAYVVVFGAPLLGLVGSIVGAIAGATVPPSAKVLRISLAIIALASFAITVTGFAYETTTYIPLTTYTTACL